MALFLVRHGERQDYVDSSWVRAHLEEQPWNPPLSGRGLRQAEELARGATAWCKRLGLDLGAVYTSPLQRCKQTAQPVAEVAGLAVQVEPRLMEWVGEGWYTGWACDGSTGRWSSGEPPLREELLAKAKMPVAELIEVEAAGAGLDYSWDRVESAEQVADRTAACAESLAARHPGKAVIVVGHLGPIVGAAQLLQGYKEINLFHDVQYTGMIILQKVETGGWTCLAHGDISHLT